MARSPADAGGHQGGGRETLADAAIRAFDSEPGLVRVTDSRSAFNLDSAEQHRAAARPGGARPGGCPARNGHQSDDHESESDDPSHWQSLSD